MKRFTLDYLFTGLIRRMCGLNDYWTFWDTAAWVRRH